MSLTLLSAAYPDPPAQKSVGRGPDAFFECLQAEDQCEARQCLNSLGIVSTAPLTRCEVYTVCRLESLPPLAKYCCIMAWGGQRMTHFLSSVAAKALPGLIEYLLKSQNSRGADFEATKEAAKAIPGLGISFYTKLLYFLRPTQDAYILDQWTSKSSVLLQFPSVIRLTRPTKNGFCRAATNTTPAEYEAFCQFLDQLAAVLWPGDPNANGGAAETAIFDKPDGLWRNIVKNLFINPIVVDSIFNRTGSPANLNNDEIAMSDEEDETADDNTQVGGEVGDFDQFWNWLSRSPQTVPTMAGRGESLTGHVENGALVLNRNGLRIQRDTVEKYFHRYPNNSIGNERWVYALIRAFKQ